MWIWHFGQICRPSLSLHQSHFWSLITAGMSSHKPFLPYLFQCWFVRSGWQTVLDLGTDSRLCSQSTVHNIIEGENAKRQQWIYLERQTKDKTSTVLILYFPSCYSGQIPDADRLTSDSQVLCGSGSTVLLVSTSRLPINWLRKPLPLFSRHSWSSSIIISWHLLFTLNGIHWIRHFILFFSHWFWHVQFFGAWQVSTGMNEREILAFDFHSLSKWCRHKKVNVYNVTKRIDTFRGSRMQQTAEWGNSDGSRVKKINKNQRKRSKKVINGVVSPRLGTGLPIGQNTT
jgi:hypothetical protein